MDIQLNISVSDKTLSKQSKNVGDKTGYNFVTKPMLSGKIVAKRKRQHDRSLSFSEPQKNIEKSKKIKSKSEDYQSFSHEKETQDLGVRLIDLAENKGNYKDKNYQSLSDDIKIKQKPRKGGWVSSLFKNNPEVPKMGQRAVRPIIEKVFSGKDFSDLEIHPHSIANIHQNLGLKELTTVQQMATPIILQGRDVLVRSQTGSGKTLAYALPIIEALQAIRPKIDRHDGIRVVVVVPTRELAVQTFELFVKLNRPFTWVVPGLLSGGQKRKAEKARLRKGLSILIGTPGRICDHLRHTQSLNFSKTRCLVLDEADRLLDMGYEKDVAEIVKAIEQHQVNSTYNPMEMMKNAVKKFDDSDDEKQQASEKIEECGNKRHKITDILLSSSRQTVLLSATLTKAVENLAGITMVDPVFVDASEGKAPLVADSLKTKTEVEAEEIKLKVEKTIKEENVVKAEPSDGKVNSRSGKQDTRKGLKQFAGCAFQHLFNETIDKTNKPNTCIEQESDSDSDYEYFKVQKQTQTNVVVKSESSDEDEKEIEQEDSFQTALKTAVEEDKIILPSSVNQNYIITPMKLRLVTLCASVIEHCIINKNSGKMIVFMATQDMVDYHCDLLEAVLTDTGVQKLKKMKVVEGMKNKEIKLAESENEKQEKSDEDEELPFEIEELLPGEPELDGLVPVSLEMFKLFGSMPHEDRIDVFKRFRKAKAGVLFCTDVAARGLDLPKVDMVFQYCVPSSVTDYVHRVGRTGRAANIGAAILLLQPGEVEFIRHLEERRVRLTQVNDRECLESLRSIVPTAKTSARAAVCLQARIEYVVNTNKEWLKRASRAYTSWIRFYAAYPRAIRPYLDSTSLHLGHAAKSFGLRDTPGAVAKRVRNDTEGTRVKPNNRLTVDKEFDKQRTGFPKMKIGGKRTFNKQSSMHTASEFDSGLETVVKKKKSTKK